MANPWRGTGVSLCVLQSVRWRIDQGQTPVLPVTSRGLMQRSRGKQSLPLRIICVFCHLESLLLTRPLHSSSCILLSFCYLSLLSSVLRVFTPSPGVVPVPCGWSGWCGWHGTMGVSVWHPGGSKGQRGSPCLRSSCKLRRPQLRGPPDLLPFGCCIDRDGGDKEDRSDST